MLVLKSMNSSYGQKTQTKILNPLSLRHNGDIKLFINRHHFAKPFKEFEKHGIVRAGLSECSPGDVSTTSKV